MIWGIVVLAFIVVLTSLVNIADKEYKSLLQERNILYNELEFYKQKTLNLMNELEELNGKTSNTI